MEDLGIRRAQEEMELANLVPYAQFSARSRGRASAESACPIRTAFARDRDRILHCKAFRRLKHKTQVFIAPEGDHYRTRLTHTLDVAQIARTIARALRLNDDLVEAIALGHDLGHTPFGHGGEEVLDRLLPGGFRHSEQSLRVVDVLEGEHGLNLSWEVRDGIRHHSGDSRPQTLEGRIVQLADRIAYINHDIDDALRAGVLAPGDIPRAISSVLGNTHTDRIDALVGDVVRSSFGRDSIELSAEVGAAMNELRNFLFQRVYNADCPAKREQVKAQDIIAHLFSLYRRHPDRLPPRYRELGACSGPPLEPCTPAGPEIEPVDRAAADYVASMTDRYAIAAFQEEWIPRPWSGGGRDA